jgi:hypothetical protein
MKTAWWLIIGLCLSCSGPVLHSAKEAGYPLIAEMPLYIPLVMVAAGQFCLFRGIRRVIGDIWTAFTGSGRKSVSDNPPRLAAGSSLGEDVEPVSDFDADAAFARYMQQRAGSETEVLPARSVKPPAPRLGSRQQAGFGRRVV